MGISLGLIFSVLLFLPTEQPAPDKVANGVEFVGVWEGLAGGGTIKEIWSIKRDKEGWTVGAAFFKGSTQVGSSRGKDVKLSDGELTFQIVFDRKPDPTWSDNTTVTATVKEDRLTFAWKNESGSGTVVLLRVKALNCVRSSAPCMGTSFLCRGRGRLVGITRSAVGECRWRRSAR
jgi:hypothetical protein